MLRVLALLPMLLISLACTSDPTPQTIYVQQPAPEVSKVCKDALLAAEELVAKVKHNPYWAESLRAIQPLVDSCIRNGY